MCSSDLGWNPCKTRCLRSQKQSGDSMDVKKADGCKCIPHAHPSAFLKNQVSAPARRTGCAAFWARCLRVHTPGEALALGQLLVAGKHSHFQITRLLGAALHAQMADRRAVKLAGGWPTSFSRWPVPSAYTYMAWAATPQGDQIRLCVCKVRLPADSSARLTGSHSP